MYLEDIITSVAMRIKLNPYDLNLIISLESQLTRGTSLTEKQSAIAIKILKRYVPQINLLDTYKNIDQWLYRVGSIEIPNITHKESLGVMIDEFIKFTKTKNKNFEIFKHAERVMKVLKLIKRR